jgi:hypothetical protein
MIGFIDSADMTKRLLPLLLLAASLVLTLAMAAAPSGGAQESPGPLSVAHAAKPGDAACAACHTAPGQVGPAKCLSCHGEIASRVAAGTGFHRDKAEECAVCHVEHQGREGQLVPLDPADFDHAETGADLRGAHLKVKVCEACHTAAATLPRAHGRSYLFKVRGCRGCHTPPHPGRQDDCLACHGQESWSVGRRPAGS